MHTLLRKKKLAGKIFRHAYRETPGNIVAINDCSISIEQEMLSLTRLNNSSNRLISRIDDVGSLSNFDISFDVFIDQYTSNTNPFFLYRTTNWSGAGLGYGYCLYFMSGQVRINAATNSGSTLPDYDHIGSVSTINGLNTVRIRVNNDSHKVWINGSKTIDTTNNRHSSGQIGFGAYIGSESNPASYYFKNLLVTKI